MEQKMVEDTPIILIENTLDELWICLPMRHKDFAVKIMKYIENGNQSDWQKFIDICVNFAVGMGETAQEAQEDFHFCDVEARNLIGIYRENLFDKIVAKKTDIQIRKLPKNFT